MTVQELKWMFTKTRDFIPEHVNELLDFAKKAYVQNEISFYDYRSLVRDLELQGAALPDDIRQLS